jgi:hypothetical protein
MSDIIKPPWTHFSWKTHPRWFPKLDVEQNPDNGIYTPAELQETKEKISSCAQQHIWEYAKKISNPYELVYTYKDSHIPESLSAVKPLSRSYFKMVEMLDLSQYLQQRVGRTAIRTAHVCEGPGGFIEAIYDVATKMGRQVRSTHAMTLRSTKSHIPGWRRAQQFMNRHREIRIEYGADNTGNILEPANRTAFVDQISKSASHEHPVHIFTADGGFDFTSNYAAQESSIFHLLVASVHIGFSVLAPDGMFILKVFDIFAPATYQLLGYMASCFNRWTVYKPATSRPCNSEQYFIGVGFRGASAEELAYLNGIKAMPEKLFADNVPDAICDTLRVQSDYMLQNQLLFLNTALGRASAWSNEPPKEDTLLQLWMQNAAAAQLFCQRFHVIHRYPLPQIHCRLALPSAASYESDSSNDHGRVHASAGLDGIDGGDNVQPDEYRQSSTLDDVSSCRSPFVPSLPASCEDPPGPLQPKVCEKAPDGLL